MKIEISDQFAVTPSELSAVLASQELMSARAEEAVHHGEGGASNKTPTYAFTQERDTDGKITQTIFSIALTVNEIPPQLRVFLPKGLHLQVNAHFSPSAPPCLLSTGKEITDDIHRPKHSAPADWAPADASEVNIDLEIQVQGAPVTATGHAHVERIASGVGEISRLTYRGELNIRIPFVGKIAEAKIREALPEIFRRDCVLIRRIISPQKPDEEITN